MTQGFRTQKPRLFGQFALYHIGLLAMFATVVYPYLHHILLMWVIQDRFFFAFKKGDTLGPEDWVNWGFGGFYVLGQWIPNLYWISLVIWGVIEYYV